MRHIRCHRETRHVLEYVFIPAGATSCGQSPYDISEFVHIHMVTYQDDLVDQHATFMVEKDLSKFVYKVLGICLEGSQPFCVDLQREPCTHDFQ